ncbi:hypothetical protein NM688_g4309 [Phlebia brevispora]|uniref:Uncharacterized protein n=1 Tax=Phlebia brevispora TaxID=194682 RepID=A0ACC1T3G5_9APHY|nr:hypothetical protein NM688_g4309 [Phlebia brevispora]
MAKLEQYPLRLPAYRSSYMNRYHPYPRVKRPLDLMRTVDRRFEDDWDEDEWTEVIEVPRSQTADYTSDNATVLLHAALNPTPSHRDSLSSSKRLSFTTLVIDLSLAFKHGCRRVLSAAKGSKL